MDIIGRSDQWQGPAAVLIDVNEFGKMASKNRDSIWVFYCIATNRSD